MSICALRLDAATTRKMAHRSLRPKMTIKMMATVPQNPQTARSVKIRLIAFSAIWTPPMILQPVRLLVQQKKIHPKSVCNDLITALDLLKRL